MDPTSMDPTSIPPSLRALHGLRQAAVDLAQARWGLAAQALRKKDSEIAAIQSQVEALEADLRQRGRTSLLELEFARLARVWRDDLLAQQELAQRSRKALHTDCEQTRIHLRACRLALRTLERYCARLHRVVRREQAWQAEREGDAHWISRNHHSRRPAWT